jgi:L-alanine-DL-glutamate epimerase-like enolase superfamily enzyme
MRVKSIHAHALSIAFNAAFKHASAERSSTQALWVEALAASGATGFGEGCPREYVTAESVTSARAFVEAHRNEWRAGITDVESLMHWVAMNGIAIDRSPAAWTAVELALLDLFGKEQGCPIEALLGLKSLAGRFAYTAVLGDAAPDDFRLQLARYLKLGFSEFKIKLSGNPERDLCKVRALAEHGVRGSAARADANNLWRNPATAAAHIRALHYDFHALEEPLAPGDYAGLAQLAERLETNIILDESLLRVEQLDRIASLGEHWIVNLRVSKMGGVVRSLNLQRALRERGLTLIVGAHVGETSVLSRAALTVASCARDILIGQEGAFGTHLLSADVAKPPLMFGSSGVIDIAHIGIAEKPGLGLDISSRRVA